MSIAPLSQLRLVAARTPEVVAIIEESGRRATFGELVARVERIERGLSAQGMRRGDRVLFAIRPSEVAIATMLAITELGAVIVAAQIGVGDELFAAQMRAVRPSWVMAESALLAAMGSKVARRIVKMRGGALPSLDALLEARFVASGPWLPGLRGAVRLEALERDTKREANERVVKEPEPMLPPNITSAAFIVFTSGTTAAPKAVVHSRGSLEATLDVVSGLLAIAPGDRLFARDLHLLLPALLAGATVYVPRSQRYDPHRTARALVQHRITHMYEVTANLVRLVEYFERSRSSLPVSLRHVMVGAAPVRQAFFRRLRNVLSANARAWCVYGMTEILPIAVIEIEEKLGYDQDGDIVGRPVDGVRVEISIDGELIVYGPHLFTGYLGGPTVSSLATGDVARIDDGRIVLMGRTKDMIIRGNYNIYPELYEPTIERVAGVRRCALVGVYNEATADERIVLAVEAEPGVNAERLARRLRHELRNGPARIDDAAQPDFIFVMPLPESGRSRKVDKRALRETARERLECA
ncbi:MAG: class I adenylate-forming enzyme family protein [Gemmatimonadaceae bacterium]|nr:class I adenylate-forming enzyme family protein [Gemmatimonadaceae bacterium]